MMSMAFVKHLSLAKRKDLNMKCFLVYAKHHDYDQYDSVAVLAESKEEVRKMFIRDGEYTYIGEEDGPFFHKSQGKIYIEEQTKKGVVCASYCAG